MAMIKGKQIQSLQAAKVVVSPERQFVTDAQITAFAAKAEVAQVETAKEEALKATSDLDVKVAGELEDLRTQVSAGGKEYTDAEIAKVKTLIGEEDVKLDTAIKAVDGKLTTVEGTVTTGLEDRYTKAQVDNLLSTVASGILYKGTVASFDEIATKFPNPSDGWLVAVEGSKKFYIYTGTEWEVFPIEMAACTTHTKSIRVVVTDGQTVIPTGIMTDGTGAKQTSVVLSQEVAVAVNGLDQSKEVDYTVEIVENEIKITWKSADFALEASDIVLVTYNQIV